MMDMITISPVFQPLHPGSNTIRKANTGYLNLRPGDAVRMEYFPSPEATSMTPLSTEYLIVKRIHIGNFDQVMQYDGMFNHAVLRRAKGWGPAAEQELRDTLKKHYHGEVDGKWIAIYF